MEKSKYASQALELSKTQEQTKQKEQMLKMKEYEAHIEQLKNDGKRVDGEQRQKLQNEKAKHDKQKAEYEDQLARRRYNDQLEEGRRVTEEKLRKEEESVARQEAMRLKTREQENEMRAKADMKRIEAESVARGKVERENQDLLLEQIRLKAKENRSTVMESIRTAGSVLGAGAEAFLHDW